jgi:serine protease
VTGTIAARQNGQGVTGVAPDSTVLTFRVFNNAGRWAYSSSVANAAYNCYASGARVINMSLGGPGFNSAENNMFSFLFSRGVVSVAAAGNAGTTAYSYPASYTGVVSVGAIDLAQRVASFSQRNNQVDLSAHGVGVFSTLPRSMGSYGTLSGTSMASPHVAGVAAILLSKNPFASATTIVNAMFSTAGDLGTRGRDDLYGWGSVNAYAALFRV